ncbi:uncharacterized protein M6B38_390120 [Iris pallida]|uniref:Uncharacterized protein n=1 Tax=Iris pallida TaxID=29817 RepID=A0AAX6G050_IRIPA|nr:uncharacterized protein M6B38_390120 [Iris pallida]
MVTVAASIRWHHHPPIPSHPSRPPPRRPRSVAPIRAFGRADLDGFARRLASGEALREAWRRASDGIELITFEARRAADRVDRRFSVSRRLSAAARAASDRARELDQELGVGRRWRTFSVDFSRNWPRYRKELSDFFETPIGRGFTTIFFLWFALSGWLFRIFILATWVLPFAAPLLIGTIAKNLTIEGSCPACRTRFVGYRNQVIRCSGCRNIVWQPGDGSSRGRGSPPRNSDPDIIDIEIEEK